MRLGNSSVLASIAGPTAAQVEVVDLVADLDHALGVADVDVLEAPLAPADSTVPVPSAGPAG